MRRAVVCLVMAALLGAAPAAGDAAAFVVIVHSDIPVGSLTVAEASAIFLKRNKKWRDGTAVRPVDLVDSSPVRESFSRSIHHRGVADIERHWQRMIFSGRDVPPPEKASERAVIDYVVRKPGAIGYVGAGASLPEGVRRIVIEDSR